MEKSHSCVAMGWKECCSKNGHPWNCIPQAADGTSQVEEEISGFAVSVAEVQNAVFLVGL